jgi:hypothetical protein
MTKVTLHKAYDGTHYYTTIGDLWLSVEHLEDGRWLITQYDCSYDYFQGTNGQMVEFFRRLKDARVQLEGMMYNFIKQQRGYEERKAARDAHEASEREPLVFPEAAPIDTVEKLQKLYDLLAECSTEFAQERDTLEVSGGWWSLLDELDTHGKHSLHDVVAYLCPYPRYYEN